MRDVIVVIGPGQIGQAIARRVGIGKHVLLADMRQDNANAAAEVLGNAGYDVSVATVDASLRETVHALVERATGLGDVTGLIHAAGVSPTQASPATILKVDLYGTALVLEEFGSVIARGGAGVVIASQSGHRFPPLTVEQNKALATTPVQELLKLPFLQPDQVTDSLRAYQISKRGNSLRVMAEALRWGKRGARVNTISPGIIMTPLAKDELRGPRGEGYRRMIEISAAGRVGTPDEVATVAALLMGPDGGFITGSDFLMDGGVTAAYWYGVSLRKRWDDMTEGIRNKVVVITGASSGLGEATARHLARAGAKLVLGARRFDRLEALSKELSLGSSAAVKTDVTDYGQVKDLVDHAVRTHGRIDVMLNNAGLMPHSPLERGKVEDWDRMIDVNIRGVLYGIAAALPHMKAQKSGHIINVSSVAGHLVRPGSAVYAATKHAVRVISEGLRQEVKPYNIRSTIISPGAVATELPQSITELDVAKGVREFYEKFAIPAASFANMVAFAISQPDDIDINEILFRPTRQEL